tara:strand:- start:2286 stop:2498 length:213 start_codon:yes stop_codon:yes gene_type:complete
MGLLTNDREELGIHISELLEELETLSEHWRSDQSDEKIWFRAVQIMGEVAPLVEEYKQQVWLETGQTFLN